MSTAPATQLTFDGRFKTSPVFAKGTDEIVFVVLDNPTLMRLMRLTLHDGKVTAMHDEPMKSQFDPDFTPDGRYFVFAHTATILSVPIIIRDTTTGKEASVPPGTGFSALRSPSVSHDGSRVAFAYSDEGKQQIYSVNNQAGDRKKLTDTRGLNNWPDFSPDGTQIVFSSSRDGNFEIYVMNADGSNQRRLTDCPFQDIRPAWSPDGKRIAFTSARDGNYEVYVMNRDGSNLVRVTNHPERDDYPAWHPDGKRLLMVCERSGKHDLWLVDAE